MMHDLEDNNNHAPRSSKPGLGLVAGCVVAAGILIVAGYMPVDRVWGNEGVTAMVFGVLVSLFACIAGSLVVVLTVSRSPEKAPVAILGATCVRFLGVLAIVAPLALTGVLHRVAFVTSVAISYLVLLALATLMEVTFIRSRQGVSR